MIANDAALHDDFASGDAHLHELEQSRPRSALTFDRLGDLLQSHHRSKFGDGIASDTIADRYIAEPSDDVPLDSR
jgi:hypothetical protein